MKKILVILLAVIIVTSLTSCVFVPLDSNQQTLNGSNDSANQPVPSAVSEKAMEIYFLNFKPEIAEVYQRIATDYESETGVKVNVVTA
ncbi:MAG: carbohydrate ABC transporter substrate-binding protein, partial [Candidatus Cloacimonetes bacterium]|nr:carbohydrate ABC transporter substrate-binding protein [Candidatus Cloacimonadota bacterium]